MIVEKGRGVVSGVDCGEIWKMPFGRGMGRNGLALVILNGISHV